MSSTFKAANAAARMVGDRARVMDTGTAAGAEGLVVLAAAEAAARGAPVDVVQHAAQRVIERVRLIATVDSLDRRRALQQPGQVLQLRLLVVDGQHPELRPRAHPGPSAGRAHPSSASSIAPRSPWRLGTVISAVVPSPSADSIRSA